MADADDPVSGPVDWDKAVSCAYLRMIGKTQEEAAKGAGVGLRTLRRWEQCSWWRQAKAEARDRWMNNLMDAARATVLEAVKEGNVEKAWQILERLDPDFRPAPQQIDHRVGIIGAVASLSHDEVRRLQQLPRDERRDELRRLVSGE